MKLSINIYLMFYTIFSIKSFNYAKVASDNIIIFS